MDIPAQHAGATDLLATLVVALLTVILIVTGTSLIMASRTRPVRIPVMTPTGLVLLHATRED